jgi:hypothetical protein
MEAAYGEATRLPQDPTLTYRMTGYYAFNWWRYEHAVHPLTPSVILETGFLTNAADREILVGAPEIAAEGLASGVLAFLASEPELSRGRMPRMIDTPVSGTYVCLEGRWDASDPPEEHGAPCRPGLRTSEGERIGLMSSGGAQEQELRSTASGTPLTVNGTYTPMVGVRDLTWYDFRVRGVIDAAFVTQNEGQARR